MSEWHGLTGAQIYAKIINSLEAAQEAARTINQVFEQDTEGHTKIKSSYLPSYVDDIVEGYVWKHKLNNKDVIGFYASYSNENGWFYDPIKGESGKIYLNLLTNDTYRCDPGKEVTGIANSSNESTATGNQFTFGTYIKVTDAELEKRLDHFNPNGQVDGSIEKEIQGISNRLNNFNLNDTVSIETYIGEIKDNVQSIEERLNNYGQRGNSIEQVLGIGGKLPTKDIGANCLYLLVEKDGDNQMGLYISKIDPGTMKLIWQRVGGLL